MRTLLICAVLALFSAHSFALDQNAVNAKIASIKQKAASGQDIKGDIASLTDELKANAKSLVVTNQVNLSVVDQSGAVSLFVPFAPTTHVIANDQQVVDHAKMAVANHPGASKAHNFDDGAVSLGGGSKKKSTTDSTAAAPAPTSSSDGGIGGLISAGLGAVVNIGGSIVSGLLGSL